MQQASEQEEQASQHRYRMGAPMSPTASETSRGVTVQTPQQLCCESRMWLLACVGVFYMYMVIVVLPTVRAGLVKVPKLAPDCTWQQRVAAWCKVLATALFNSARLSADNHKNAPETISHTVTNKQLATLARRASIRYGGPPQQLETKCSAASIAVAKQQQQQQPPRPASYKHHKRTAAGSSPATLMTALERMSLNQRLANLPRLKEEQSLPITTMSADCDGSGAASDGIWQSTGRRMKRALQSFRRRSGSDYDAGVYKANTDRATAAGLGLPSSRQKLVVVLDLDECLVHSIFSASTGSKGAENDRYRQQEYRPAAPLQSSNSLHVTISSDSSSGADANTTVTVNTRPGLDAFLKALSSEYTVIVFTAGCEEYASKVLDAIDPKGVYFSHRLYRASCRQARGGIYLKDLDTVVATLLSQQQQQQQQQQPLLHSARPYPLYQQRQSVEHQSDPLARMILVDNSPLSFICQPKNGVLVSSWYDDVQDNALESVLKLVRHIDACGDVRPTLEALFGLEPVLKQYHDFVLADLITTSTVHSTVTTLSSSNSSGVSEGTAANTSVIRTDEQTGVLPPKASSPDAVPDEADTKSLRLIIRDIEAQLGLHSPIATEVGVSNATATGSVADTCDYSSGDSVQDSTLIYTAVHMGG